MEHEDLGLTLHPFDLATNKVLALVGRLEVRDWVDVLPAEHVGEVVLHANGHLLQCEADELAHERQAGRVHFHAGRIGGALPQFK